MVLPGLVIAFGMIGDTLLYAVLVIERGHASDLSSQASYSTWRDFGAAVGPLSAPWLFLSVVLAVALGMSAYFCLVRR
jgi:hypothetical protein